MYSTCVQSGAEDVFTQFAIGIEKAYGGIRENGIMLVVILFVGVLLAVIGVTLVRMAIKTYFMHRSMFPVKDGAVRTVESLDNEIYQADMADQQAFKSASATVRRKLDDLKKKYAEYNRQIAARPGGDQAVVDERVLDPAQDDYTYPAKETEIDETRFDMAA